MDIKITDDEEDEELDVTGPVRPEQPPVPQPPAPEPEPEGETLPSMQFFVVRGSSLRLLGLYGVHRGLHLLSPFLSTVIFISSLPRRQENPSEEDAAIVDKVLSMRVVKKEVRDSGGEGRSGGRIFCRRFAGVLPTLTSHLVLRSFRRGS